MPGSYVNYYGEADEGDAFLFSATSRSSVIPKGKGFPTKWMLDADVIGYKQENATQQPETAVDPDITLPGGKGTKRVEAQFLLRLERLNTFVSTEILLCAFRIQLKVKGNRTVKV